jgi:molybdate/tungstate transport system substrate-binding protein
MKKMKFILFFTIAIFAITIIPLSVNAGSKTKLTIFHAGSLTVPFAKIEKDFEAKYPDIDVQREAGGSTKMARMISEVGKPADIMAAADYKVIDNNLIPKFADFNIRFATNQLVLCYTDQSKFAKEINAENWYKILEKKGVDWGHSDPNLDPCGYRTLMVLQLAEKFYNIKGLAKKLIDNRPKKNIRPKAVELVNLVKTGNMDYAWEYLSVAIQHNLKYIKMSEHINLGNYKYDAFYKLANVKVTGKKPGTWITKKGKSCTYGITLIKNCPHPKAAKLFLKFLLSPDHGLKTLKEMGQPPFIPCRVPTKTMADKIPSEFANLIEVKE